MFSALSTMSCFFRFPMFLFLVFYSCFSCLCGKYTWLKESLTILHFSVAAGGLIWISQNQRLNEVGRGLRESKPKQGQLWKYSSLLIHVLKILMDGGCPTSLGNLIHCLDVCMVQNFPKLCKWYWIHYLWWQRYDDSCFSGIRKWIPKIST